MRKTLIEQMFSDHPPGRDVVRVLTRAITTTSIEVWLLGPIVKSAGFDALLLTMAGIAVVTFSFMLLLPERSAEAARATLAARAAE